MNMAGTGHRMRRPIIIQVSNGSVRIPSANSGGVELTIANLCQEYRKLGCHPLVIDNCYVELSDQEGLSPEDGIDVLRVRSGNQRSISAGTSLVYKLLRLLGRSKFMIKSAIRIRTIRVDAVQVYDALAAALLSFFLPKTKIVYTHVSSYWPSPSNNRLPRILTRILSPLINTCSIVVVQNRFAASSLIAGGVDTAKVSVITPGLNVTPSQLFKYPHIENFRINLPKLYVLFVGRINHEKGVDVLLESINFIVNRKNRKNIMFLFAGPIGEFEKDGKTDSYLDALTDFVKANGLGHFVRFLGRVASNELAVLYDNCLCLVLPSRRETFGHVIGEAFLFSKPVIATRTLGAEMQIKDGETGFLVGIGEATTIADRILQFVDNPELAVAMGRLANARMEGKGWDKVASKYLDLIANEKTRPVI